MTAFELFKICGQLGTLFLMTYLEILQYAVNLSLYTEVLHCTILKSITFPPPLFNFIIFPGKMLLNIWDHLGKILKLRLNERLQIRG